MNIISIEADKDQIRFFLDVEEGEIELYEHVGTVGAQPGRRLSAAKASVRGGQAALPRFSGGRDRMYSRWAAYADGRLAGGVCYVTDIADDVPENGAPYPQPAVINCICRPWRPEARSDLGAYQTQFDVNLPELMTVHPRPGDIEHSWNGEKYYFARDKIEDLDAFLISEPEVTHTAVMVCHKARVNRQDQELVTSFFHPGFDWDCPSAFISAFNMQTEDGLRHFCAFSDFLGQRYSRPDRKYGQIAGYVVSNEVTSQYVWGNAGEMPMEQYCEEYLHAMRMTWLCVARHWKAARVYASFDHFWSGLTFDMTLPRRFYPGRDMLDLFLKFSLRDGNFPWHLAHHPYPENLNYPDFWNDRTADFSFDTPRVTYKNMEVLEAYLAQEPFLYKGRPRRIVFSEQSLNSKKGPLAALSEKQAAAGYMLSYLKARKMKTVDMMMHRLLDDPHEFGLSLGLYRFDEDAPDHFGGEKPICQCVRAVDTPKEAEYVEKARAFIGPELFDYLLDPPPITRNNADREFEIVTH